VGNDGDNYRTKSMTFDNIEKAKAVEALCKTVFCSGSNGSNGIGNLGEDESAQAAPIIIDFMISNLVLCYYIDLEKLTKDIRKEYPEDITDETPDSRVLEFASDFAEDNEEYFSSVIDDAMELNYNLLGGSEYYYSRVYESSTLTYSPEDIYVEEVE